MFPLFRKKKQSQNNNSYTFQFIKKRCYIKLKNEKIIAGQALIEDIKKYAHVQMDDVRLKHPDKHMTKHEFTLWDDILKYERISVHQLKELYPQSMIEFHIKQKPLGFAKRKVD